MNTVRKLGSKATLTLLATAVAFLSAVPTGAEAGQYTVYSCQTVDGVPTGMAAWVIKRENSVVNDVSSEACPAGPFELKMVAAKTHPGNDAMNATFTAPTGTAISGYSFWRSAEVGTSYHYRFYGISNGEFHQYDSCIWEEGCRSKGTTSNPTSPLNLVQQPTGLNLQAFEFLITCGLADTETCPATTPAAQFQLYRGEVTLEDDEGPLLTAPPSGPLTEPGRALTGLVPVSISATDRGGGVYQAMFEVDGKIVQAETIDDNGGYCQIPFEIPQPCKLNVSGTVNFNTTVLPDGHHTLRILVSDATGTNVGAWGPISIETDNAQCNPLPRVASLVLRSSFAGQKRKRPRRTLKVDFGEEVKVKGSLLSLAGQPVPGAGLCVADRTQMVGGQLTPLGNVSTDANGHFTFPVGPGPSRRVYFVSRVEGGAVSSSVQLKVRAPVHLKQSGKSLHNGQVLVLSGRLGARAYVHGNLMVLLQAERSPHHWQTFGTTHTNRKGEFHYPYRFTRTVGVQHYRLRAQVPAQETYPFATGCSKPIVARVVGP